MSHERSLSPLAALLRQILLIEKRRPLGEVAAAMGIEYSNLYGRVTGRVQLNAEELSALLRVLPDPRILDLLLSDTPFVAVVRPDGGDNHPVASAAELGLRSIEEIIAASHDIVAALNNDDLDGSARTRVEGHVAEAQRHLASLRLALQSVSAGMMERR
jgi:hypothetical protein